MNNRRILKDIRELVKSPLEDDGIYFVHDESSIRHGHALLIGPSDTPYDSGFYLFSFEFPDSYPFQPPVFSMVTNDVDGIVRLHPNLYPNGTVCLSIINTYPGPSWSCTQTLSSILLSIQSLFDSRPLTHEPCYEKAEESVVTAYNLCIAHENLRIAVIRCVREIRSGPFSIYAEKVEEHFLKNFETYRKVCEKHCHRDGELVNAPAYGFNVRLHFRTLFGQLLELRDSVANRKTNAT
ncbi:MAG: ubiquitin-conjugating enzyme E2 [Sulfobacillus sp.]